MSHLDGDGSWSTGPLRCEVLRRYPVALVVATGLLRLDTAAALRITALKVLADRPTALVLDLAAVEVLDAAAVTVLAVVEHHAAAWADAAVLLAAPSHSMRVEIAHIGQQLSIHESRSAALTAAAQRPVPARVRLPFPADIAAPAAARKATHAACLRWELGTSLAERAAQVVTELVSNVVHHAGTQGVLLLSRRRTFLHVAVRDGNRAPPVLPRRADSQAQPEAEPRAFGLQLVDALSSGWGVRIVPDGKVVWATLRVWSTAGQRGAAVRRPPDRH